MNKEKRNILFVTDLSPESMELVHQAAVAARETDSRLILLYSYQPEIQTEILETIASDESEQDTGAILPPEREAQRRLDMLANELHRSFQISITRILKPNLTERDISSIASQLKADLHNPECSFAL